jgi:hypothetical protein
MEQRRRRDWPGVAPCSEVGDMRGGGGEQHGGRAATARGRWVRVGRHEAEREPAANTWAPVTFRGGGSTLFE